MFLYFYLSYVFCTLRWDTFEVHGRRWRIVGANMILTWEQNLNYLKCTSSYMWSYSIVLLTLNWGGIFQCAWLIINNGIFRIFFNRSFVDVSIQILVTFWEAYHLSLIIIKLQFSLQLWKFLIFWGADSLTFFAVINITIQIKNINITNF